jgi:hypothetical protein
MPFQAILPLGDGGIGRITCEHADGRSHFGALNAPEIPLAVRAATGRHTSGSLLVGRHAGTKETR